MSVSKHWLILLIYINIINYIVKEVITEKKKEEVDKEQRKANLIIYRAKESNKENSEERQNEDKQFFDALCNDILGIGPVKTKNIMISLGKQKTYLRILASVQIITKMSGRKSEPWPQKQRKNRKRI